MHRSALAVENGPDFTQVWTGDNDEYDRMVG